MKEKEGKMGLHKEGMTQIGRRVATWAWFFAT